MFIEYFGHYIFSLKTVCRHWGFRRLHFDTTYEKYCINKQIYIISYYTASTNLFRCALCTVYYYNRDRCKRIFSILLNRVRHRSFFFFPGTLIAGMLYAQWQSPGILQSIPHRDSRKIYVVDHVVHTRFSIGPRAGRVSPSITTATAPGRSGIASIQRQSVIWVTGRLLGLTLDRLPRAREATADPGPRNTTERFVLRDDDDDVFFFRPKDYRGQETPAAENRCQHNV